MPPLLIFLRHGFRPLLIATLLVLIWAVVVPYQAAVRIDQALSKWVRNQPDMQLIRSAQSPFLRDYQIRWQPAGSAALILNLQLHTRPPAFWLGQVTWGQLTLRVDAHSPWQIHHWNRQPFSLDGSVTGLGRWQLTQSAPASASDEIHIARAPGSGDWQLTGNWPGLILTHGDHTLWLGRCRLLLRQQTTAEGWDTQASLQIRRLGWRFDDDRGQLDQLDLRWNNFTTANTHRVSGAAGLMMQRVIRSEDPDRAPGVFQANGQWHGVTEAFPAAVGHLLNTALGTAATAPLSLSRLWAQITTNRTPIRISEALDEVLQAAGRGVVLLDSAHWGDSAGNWHLVGRLSADMPEPPHRSGLDVILRAEGDARSWLLNHTPLPPPPFSTEQWNIQYHPPYWRITPQHATAAGAPVDAHPLFTD